MSTDRRMQGLNVIRAFNVGMVLFSHCIDSTTFFGTFERSWWVLVDLFFVLSAFLVTLSILSALDRGETPFGALRYYFWKRWWRILPTYLVCIGLIPVATRILAWLVSAQGDLSAYLLQRGHDDAIRYLTLTHNLGSVPLVNSFWSIAVEEHFYVLFPLVLFGLVWSRGAFRRWPVASIVVALVFSCLIRVWVIHLHPEAVTGGDPATLDGAFNPPYYRYIYMPSWCRLDGFFVGVWLAANHNRIRMSPKVAAWGVLLSVIGLFGVGMVTAFAGHTSPRPYTAVVFQYAAVAVMSAVLIATVLRCEMAWPWKNNSIIEWMSERIYSIYIGQAIVVFIAYPVITTANLDESTRWIVGIPLALVCIAFGGWLYRRVEKPYMDFAMRFRPARIHRKQAPGAVLQGEA